jgi:hypothetical protein
MGVLMFVVDSVALLVILGVFYLLYATFLLF